MNAPTNIPNKNLYYVQDSRNYTGNCMMFWAKKGNGYVNDVSKAEVFTHEQAVKLCTQRRSDKMWLKNYIDSIFKPTVDFQDADRIAETSHYVQG